MKQIKIEQLLPLLKKGWVAYTPRQGWRWYPVKPKPALNGYQLWMYQTMDWWQLSPISKEDAMLDIEPFEGDWKDSLIKVKHKELKDGKG